MRKWLGSICIILGIACLLGAGGLAIYNRLEAQNAAEASQSLLVNVQTAMDKGNNAAPSQITENDAFTPRGKALADEFSTPANTPAPTENAATEAEHTGTASEMATVKVDGYDCIGILSIPVLELELPVLTDWSYSKLEKAPCLYYGSYYEGDFVIAAHNYQAHFGRLSQLQAGDIVAFTNVTGQQRYYEVVLLETLPKEATREMIISGFDMSLYTCTPGGANRITARCSLIKVVQ